jgi:hypothetical protein
MSEHVTEITDAEVMEMMKATDLRLDRRFKEMLIDYYYVGDARIEVWGAHNRHEPSIWKIFGWNGERVTAGGIGGLVEACRWWLEID